MMTAAQKRRRKYFPSIIYFTLDSNSKDTLIARSVIVIVINAKFVNRILSLLTSILLTLKNKNENMTAPRDRKTIK